MTMDVVSIEAPIELQRIPSKIRNSQYINYIYIQADLALHSTQNKTNGCRERVNSVKVCLSTLAQNVKFIEENNFFKKIYI